MNSVRRSLFRGTTWLCLTVGFAGCSSEGEDTDRTSKSKAVLVSVEKAKRGPIRDWIEISGATKPQRRLSVASQVEGILQFFPFR